MPSSDLYSMGRVFDRVAEFERFQRNAISGGRYPTAPYGGLMVYDPKLDENPYSSGMRPMLPSDKLGQMDPGQRWRNGPSNPVFNPVGRWLDKVMKDIDRQPASFNDLAVVPPSVYGAAAMCGRAADGAFPPAEGRSPSAVMPQESIAASGGESPVPSTGASGAGGPDEKPGESAEPTPELIQAAREIGYTKDLEARALASLAMKKLPGERRTFIEDFPKPFSIPAGGNARDNLALAYWHARDVIRKVRPELTEYQQHWIAIRAATKAAAKPDYVELKPGDPTIINAGNGIGRLEAWGVETGAYEPLGEELEKKGTLFRGVDAAGNTKWYYKDTGGNYIVLDKKFMLSDKRDTFLATEGRLYLGETVPRDQVETGGGLAGELPRIEAEVQALLGAGERSRRMTMDYLKEKHLPSKAKIEIIGTQLVITGLTGHDIEKWKKAANGDKGADPQLQAIFRRMLPGGTRVSINDVALTTSSRFKEIPRPVPPASQPSR